MNRYAPLGLSILLLSGISTPLGAVADTPASVRVDANAYYRSEQNCVMFTRVDYFCRVCADAIEAVIDEYTLDAN